MFDPWPLIIALVLLAGGPAMFYWSKEFTMLEARFNLWFWYRFLPTVVEPIYGKKEDLENSPAIKIVSWWNKFIGIGVTLMGILWLIAVLGQ